MPLTIRGFKGQEVGQSTTVNFAVFQQPESEFSPGTPNNQFLMLVSIG